MNSIDMAVNQLVSSVKESAIYVEYVKRLAEVNQFPELKKRIDEFRIRNFELQNSADIDIAKLELLEKEYENFRENPLVADFLAAELALCRLLQGICNHVVGEMQFD